MMTMFGALVQRFTSPVTSPTSPRRRFKSPSRWEVQSDPEDDPAAPVRKSRAKHLLDKRKSKSRTHGLHSSDHLQNGWHDAAFPPLRGTKSLGRLDGMKEVSFPKLELFQGRNFSRFAFQQFRSPQRRFFNPSNDTREFLRILGVRLSTRSFLRRQRENDETTGSCLISLGATLARRSSKIDEAHFWTISSRLVY